MDCSCAESCAFRFSCGGCGWRETSDFLVAVEIRSEDSRSSLIISSRTSNGLLYQYLQGCGFSKSLMQLGVRKSSLHLKKILKAKIIPSDSSQGVAQAKIKTAGKYQFPTVWSSSNPSLKGTLASVLFEGLRFRLCVFLARPLLFKALGHAIVVGDNSRGLVPLGQRVGRQGGLVSIGFCHF